MADIQRNLTQGTPGFIQNHIVHYILEYDSERNAMDGTFILQENATTKELRQDGKDKISVYLAQT